MILKYITPKKNTHAREQKEVRNRLNESLKQKLRVKRIGNITNLITVNGKIFLNLVYIQYICILIIIFLINEYGGNPTSKPSAHHISTTVATFRSWRGS